MKRHTSKKKASLALAVLRGEKLSSLASTHQIHPNQIKRWKDTLESEAENLFIDKRKKENYSKDRIIEELYKIIGQRDVEISWLKKKFNLELPREIDISK